MKKNKNFIESFNNAINGIIYTIRNERNIKFHIAAGVLVLILSFFYRLTKIELLVVCLTIAFVIVCELINTAIEVLVDSFVHVYHPKAKVIKDVAAGAVLISAFSSLIVAYFIFFDKLSISLEVGFQRLKQLPALITVIALIITVIAVLMLKALFKKGSPFSGGMPSGHSAIAFAITTAIWFWTENAQVTLFCAVISLLVLQSRLEAKIHNMLELAAGALLGFLVALLLFQVFYT